MIKISLHQVPELVDGLYPIISDYLATPLRTITVLAKKYGTVNLIFMEKYVTLAVIGNLCRSGTFPRAGEVLAKNVTPAEA
jgi:hypothetical protein